MATVTVTETGVGVTVSMSRSESGVDSVSMTAASVTDVPQVAGRSMPVADITATLTAPQLVIVKQVLDFIQAKAKAAWQIP
jgi:hypothetical protein